MNKSKLIVFKYNQIDELSFQDTYLAPSSYGLQLGLEFSADPTNVLYIGQTITVDKTNKTINSWADGEFTIIGFEPSSVYVGGITVFLSKNLQLPITFSSGENGVIKIQNLNSTYEFYGELDLSKDEPLPLTFSIADIKDPSKRNTTFSKTISLPGTKDNNKFFKQIYEVGADDSFNANLKVNAVLYSEGQEQLNGVLQLKKIRRDDLDNITYEINLFGTFSNIFYNLGELKLNKLDLGEYNHIFNSTNVKDSWNTKIQKNQSNYVNWTTGYTTTFTDTFFVEGGYVGLICAAPHSFNVGDYIWVEKDDLSINQTYNGTAIVIALGPNNNEIVINKLWGENSANESGTVYVKNPTGEGYVYPLIFYGNNGLNTRVLVEELAPSVYVKTIVDKIFQTAGFTYESNFFDSPFFKRLIIPFTGEYLVRDTQELQLQEFRAGITGGTQLYEIRNDQGPRTYPINFNCDVSGATHPDLYDNYEIETNGASQNYFVNIDTVNVGGVNYNRSKYIGQSFLTSRASFEANLQFQLSLRGNPSGSNLPPSNTNIRIKTLNGTNPTFVFTFKIFKYDGATGVLSEIGSLQQSLSVPNNTTFTYGGITFSEIYNSIVQAIDIPINAGDEIWTSVQLTASSAFVENVSNPNIQYGYNYGLRFNENSRFLNVCTDNKLKEDEFLEIGQVLPDIKCTDFFMSLVKMFNLYVDEKKEATNILRIEPRDDYYALGQKVDWNKKIDISQPIEITPIAEINFKDYVYTYKADKDYWNENYTTLTQEIYGQFSYSTQNEFTKNQTKNEVIFSPTPQTQDSGSQIASVEIKTKNANDATATFKNYKANIRILFYGGLKTYKGYELILNDGDFLFGGITERYYPYCGMEDDPYIYYNSLCFGFPDFWFYPRPAGFNNTLFNKFYRNQVVEITDSDSKSISASFYLSPSDISVLDFRNLIYFQGTYYRLNKISDFNPLTNSPTKVELIKVNDITYFNAKIYNNGGGNDNLDDEGVKVPDNQSQNPVFDNQGTIIGRNNNVFTSNNNYTVVGDSNSIYQNTKNVLILGGDNNYIRGGLENIQIIGVSNATITDSNTIAIGGTISKNGITYQGVNKLDGGFYDTEFSGLTGYQAVYSTTSPFNPQINVINGIEDAAFYIGSPLNIDVFDASEDITYQI